MIKANAHKYSVSAMCKVLQIPRSTYYYESKQRPDNSILNTENREIFRQSRNKYGTRKMKVELAKKKLDVSHRRIGRIMKGRVRKQGIFKSRCNLEAIQIFHTDRGNEFKNRLLDETLEAFHIRRSLSMKGCPYDKAVAEAAFKIIRQNL